MSILFALWMILTLATGWTASVAHIAFVFIPERGHLGGVLGLTKELAKRGHRVTFASVGDEQEALYLLEKNE
jgi:hypothetical protein